MRNKIVFIFLLSLGTSCKTETRQKQNCDNSFLNEEIHKIDQDAFDLTVEETKLIRNLMGCNDTVAIKEIDDFNRYFVKYALANSFDRQSDLLLACNETDSRMIADTLYNLKNPCQSSVSTNFLSNGFEKVIESDFNYYDRQILFEDAYKHYGQGVNVNLKKYWIENYSDQMTLGEIIILMKKIRTIIYKNNVTIEKNALFMCASKQ